MVTKTKSTPQANLFAAYNSFRRSETALVAIGDASREARQMLTPTGIDEISFGLLQLGKVSVGSSSFRPIAEKALPQAAEALVQTTKLGTSPTSHKDANLLAISARQALSGAMTIIRSALPSAT